MSERPPTIYDPNNFWFLFMDKGCMFLIYPSNYLSSDFSRVFFPRSPVRSSSHQPAQVWRVIDFGSTFAIFLNTWGAFHLPKTDGFWWKKHAHDVAVWLCNTPVFVKLCPHRSLLSLGGYGSGSRSWIANSMEVSESLVSMWFVQPYTDPTKNSELAKINLITGMDQDAKSVLSGKMATLRLVQRRSGPGKISWTHEDVATWKKWWTKLGIKTTRLKPA